MIMIKIAPYLNGAHENQTYHGVIPDGWAVVPPEVDVPDTFPFVNVTAENGIVTGMTAGVVPSEPVPQPVPEEPTQLDRLEAQALYTALLTGTLLEGK